MSLGNRSVKALFIIKPSLVEAELCWQGTRASLLSDLLHIFIKDTFGVFDGSIQGGIDSCSKPCKLLFCCAFLLLSSKSCISVACIKPLTLYRLLDKPPPPKNSCRKPGPAGPVLLIAHNKDSVCTHHSVVSFVYLFTWVQCRAIYVSSVSKRILYAGTANHSLFVSIKIIFIRKEGNCS